MKPNDKRYIENMRVKKSIQTALFSLMKKKKFSETRVADIVSMSDVAKASYYRNFSSIEDVIYFYIDQINEELAELMPKQHDINMKTIRQNLIILYKYYLEHREEILLLCSNGFYELIQDNTDQFLINAIGDMPSNSIDRYNIYLLSGEIRHVQIEWLKNKAPESPEAFADFNKKCYISNESSAFTHICKFPSRYNLTYSSGSSTASEVNAQSDPGVVFKFFSASQQSMRSI